MSEVQGITRELSLGEVVSKTFELYRRDLAKYLTLFLVVETILGVSSTLIQSAIVLPTVPPITATPLDMLNWLPGFIGAGIALFALTAIVALVFYPVSIGSAVKLASDEIVTGKADLMASIQSSFSRIVWLWIVGIVVGIIVLVGVIALVVPGIILAMMLSLVLPAVIIEGLGLESLGRSRKLVAGRWLKTLALTIVFAIIVGISSAVAGAISATFGSGSTIASSILSAFYLPLIPIALTVYYYSNVARISSAQTGQTPTASGAMPQAGMKFCPNCGTQLASSMSFCPTCGAKQPT